MDHKHQSLRIGLERLIRHAGLSHFLAPLALGVAVVQPALLGGAVAGARLPGRPPPPRRPAGQAAVGVAAVAAAVNVEVSVAGPAPDDQQRIQEPSPHSNLSSDKGPISSTFWQGGERLSVCRIWCRIETPHQPDWNSQDLRLRHRGQKR